MKVFDLIPVSVLAKLRRAGQGFSKAKRITRR